MGQRARALGPGRPPTPRSATLRPSPGLALLLSCATLVGAAGCGAPPPEPVPDPATPAVDPWAGLPPLAPTEAPPPPSTQAGPPPPAAVDQTLPPLRLTPSPLPRSVPLRVVTHPPLDGNPQGAIAYVFNQPMVDPAHPPAVPPAQIQVSPVTDGAVSWVGDRTLVFAPRQRFRFATRYDAVLRPGLVSRAGRRLGAAVATGFTTRTPALVETRPQPGEVVDPFPVFTLRFNQPVDPAAVLARLRLEGPRSPGLQLDPRRPPEPRVVRLEPLAPLQPSATYRLRLLSGLGSSEGPLRSEQTTALPFTTAGPQRLVAASCATTPCLPHDVIQLTVQGEHPTEATCRAIEITPAPAERQCRPRGRGLWVDAQFLPGGTYHFRLGTDAPETPPLAVTVGRPQTPLALFPDRPLLVLRPGATLPCTKSPGAASARVAPVRPALVISVLQAIAAPDAIAPFHLAEGLPRALPLPPAAGRGVPLSMASLTGAKAGSLWLVALEGEPARASPTPSRRVALLQITALTLAARYGADGGVALVAGPDGAPRPAARLSLRDRHGVLLWQGRPDPSGLARFPGRRRLRGPPPYTLWADLGEDRTFLVLDGGSEDDFRAPGYLGSAPMPDLERLIGAVLSDRPRYRPGERVRLFGALRGQTRLPRGTIGHLPGRFTEVSYRVTGPRQEEVASGSVRLGVAGLFAVTFRLPPQAHPGRYTAWFGLASTDRALADWVLGSFVVAPSSPGLRLTVAAPSAPARLGQPTTVAIGLTGMGGSPVAGATLRWQLYRQRGGQTPAGFTDFFFGDGEGELEPPEGTGGGGAADAIWVADGEGHTDAAGELRLQPTLSAPTDLARASYVLVVDAETLEGRRARRSGRWTASRYGTQLGIHTPGRVVAPRAPVEVSVVSLRAAGEPRALSEATVEARREETDGAAASCQVHLAAAADSCLLTLPGPGRWILQARAPGALPASTLVVQAADAQATPRPGGLLRVVHHRDAVPTGRPATALLQSPVVGGTTLLTLERDGVAWARALPVRQPDTLTEVPMDAALPPGAWLSALLVPPAGGAPRPLDALMDRARLGVIARGNTLQVTATLPRRPLRPGATVPIVVQVSDPLGHPTSAALFVHLAPLESAGPLPDLGSRLLTERSPGVALRTTLAHIAQIRPGTADPTATLPGLETEDSERSGPEEGPEGEGASPSGPGNRVALRGPLRTDAGGRATVRLPLPRRPDRYRLVVLAADLTHPDRFGRDQRRLDIRPALGLRAEPPRLLRRGDRATFRVSLHNRTAHAGRVELRVRSTGAPVHPRRFTLELGAGERRDVHLRIRAAEPGLARIQLAAWLGPHRRAVEHRVPVLDVNPAAGLRDRLGWLQGTARLPLIPGTPPGAAPGWLTLTLAGTPYGACRELLARLVLQERPTLAGTALRLLALGLAHEAGYRPALAPWLDDASFTALGTQATRHLRALQLPGGAFRRHLGGPPADLADVGLALLALHHAQASGLALPAGLLSPGVARLRTLTRQRGAPLEERTRAVALLRAMHRFLRPATLQALARPPAAMGPAARARLRWVRAGAGAPSAQTPWPGEAASAPRAAEIMALRLLTQVAAGTPPRGADDLPRRLFETLAQRTEPWTTLWALLALRAAAARQRPARGVGPVAQWLGPRLLGRATLRRTGADLLHRSLALPRGPATAGRDLAVTLSAPRPGGAYYFASLRTTPSYRPRFPGVSLATHYEPSRGSPTPPGALVLQRSDTAVGRLTLVTTDSLPETVLRVPIPAGARVVDPGSPTWSGRPAQPGRPRFPPLPVLDLVQRSAALYLQVDALPPGIHEYRWVIQATLHGRFRCAPATLRRTGDERLLAAEAPCTELRVSRPAASTPRP